jgi:hypothetical protein
MMTDEELIEALTALYAYDTGSVDSGIHDDALKARCFDQLRRYPFEAVQNADDTNMSACRCWIFYECG